MKTDKLTYQKNVRVNDPQFFLRCENLELQLDLSGNKRTNQPAAPLATPFGGGIRGIREVDATGGVLFSNKVDGSHALADRIQYFATNDVFDIADSDVDDDNPWPEADAPTDHTPTNHGHPSSSS